MEVNFLGDDDNSSHNSFDEEYEDSRILLKFLNENCKSMKDMRKAVNHFIQKHKTELGDVETLNFIQTVIKPQINVNAKINPNFYKEGEEKSRKKTKIDAEKMDMVLNKLKESIEDMDESPIEFDEDPETLGDIFKSLKNINSSIKRNNQKSLYLYFSLGRFLTYVKNYCIEEKIKTDQFYKMVEECDITYSKSYIKFLISFYARIQQYNYEFIIFKSTLPISFYNSYWRIIKELIINGDLDTSC